MKFKPYQGQHTYNSKLTTNARQNRKNTTNSELLIWNMVLRKKRLGYKFIRQKPFGNYILDFYCAKLFLGVEIDGSTHEAKGDYDYYRDKYFKSKNLKIIHYSNNQVEKYLENIFLDLQNKIKIREKELVSIPKPTGLRPPPLKRED